MVEHSATSADVIDPAGDAPQRVLNGRYELGEVIGSGGMGEVRRARDLTLGRPVAVKLLRSGVADEEVQRARLRAEARLAGALRHPGIAAVYDYGEDAADPGSAPFLVMELVDGRPLSRMLADGPLPVEQTADVIAQVADALAAAHALGTVHRDIKPSNIMVTEDGSVMLVDFGIATSPGLEPLTSTGTFVGTADYLSPEQAGGRPATASSDLYALGLVAYQCLTGQLAFRRETSIATALAQINDPLPALPGFVPVALAELVRDLTRKDPLDRPSSAADVAARARGAGVASVPATGVLPVVSAPPRPPADVRWWHSTRRRVAAVVTMLVAAIVGVVGVSGFGDEPAPVPDVVGMSADAAADLLEEDGLIVRRETVDDPRAVEGTVLGQTPKAGADADSVTLTVASGMVDVRSGDLVGKDYATVAAALESLGLAASQATVEQAAGAGTVVALSATGRVPIGTAVTATVAVAPPPPPVAAPVVRAPVASSSDGDDDGGSGDAKGKGKKDD